MNTFLINRFGQVGAPDLAGRIASNVRQSREFFEAAANTSIQTKPTLVYYGQLNLASATYGLLANRHIVGTHGMARDPSSGLGTWAIRFHEKGAIQCFAELFGVRVSIADGNRGSTPIPVSLIEFLQRDPTASALLERYGEASTLSIPAYQIGHAPQSVGGIMRSLWHLRVSNAEDRVRIHRFAQVVPPSLLPTSASDSVWIEQPISRPLGFERTVDFGQFISPALPGQHFWWPYPIRHMAIGWLVSEVSRYKPELLGTVASPGSRELTPLVELVMQDITRMFPNECLNLIYGGFNFFGLPAVL